MKTMKLVSLALALALLVAGCGPAAPQEEQASSSGGSVDTSGRVTLEFWYSLSGDSGKVVEEMVQEYNASQSEVTVNATYQGNYAAIIAKIYSAVAGGALPNVAQLGGAPLLGSSGAILPITEFSGREDGFDLSAIRPAFIDYNTADGTLWSMPFNNSVPVMYYNRDMFKAASLDPDKPPVNFDELIEAGKKLTLDPENTGFTTQYGINTKEDSHWYLSAMFLGNGAEIVSADLQTVLYNSSEAVEMLALWGEMVNQHKIMPPNQHSEAQTDFLAGKLAIYFASSASINSIQEAASFDLGVAMFPQVGQKERSIPIGGGSLVIFKHDNETMRNASWAFIKYMTSKDSSIYLSQNTGYLPIYGDALDWPEIQTLMEKETLRRGAIESLQYAVAIPVFSALGNSDLALRQAVEKVELGTSSAEDALNQAAASVNQAIKEQFSTQ